MILIKNVIEIYHFFQILLKVIRKKQRVWKVWLSKEREYLGNFLAGLSLLSDGVMDDIFWIYVVEYLEN